MNTVPYRGACANYMCTLYGCQGHCGYAQPGWTTHSVPVMQPGCICPPGSERTCQALMCYRRGAQVPAKVSGRAKGGFARAASMTPEQRSEQARKAANARWSASGTEAQRAATAETGVVHDGPTAESGDAQ